MFILRDKPRIENLINLLEKLQIANEFAFFLNQYFIQLIHMSIRNFVYVTWDIKETPSFKMLEIL